MKTNPRSYRATARKSTRASGRSYHLFGIAVRSALALSLFAGLSAAKAQTPAPGASGATPQNGRRLTAPLQKLTPQQRNAMFRPSHRPVQLEPIFEPTHPISVNSQLAQSLDLSGPTLPIKGHIPALVAQSTKLAPLAADQQLTVSFNLRPRDQAGMDDLVKRLYAPKDPLFHHFLTPAQRIARFSPTQDDFNKVAAFAQLKGLRILNATADHQILKVSGTVKQLQEALGIELDTYQVANGKTFYAPDREPSLPQTIAPLLVGIEHLSNADQPRAAYAPGHQGFRDSGIQANPAPNLPEHLNTRTPEYPVSGGIGFGADDIAQWDGIGIPASEIQYAYDLSFGSSGVLITGAGQRIALVEFNDFNSSDIAGYINYNAYSASPAVNLNQIPTQYHFLAGSDPGIGQWTPECELDIEMIEAVADGVSQIDVYEEAGNTLNDELNQIEYDGKDNEVSISYEWDEISASQTSEAFTVGLTEQLAIQGQAVFAASGDYGAYGQVGSLTVNIAAASPWVTGVGGTSLSLTSGGYFESITEEVAWNSGNGVNASGGGISQYIGIPPYQIDYFEFNPFAGDASTENRNVPDVAWDADPNTGVYAFIEGNGEIVGGTSCGAPVWAAFWAQLNQYRALNGQSNMGFANPALYNDAGTSNYPFDFDDITLGGNNYFYTSQGYDCVTGLGAMNGMNLANDLLYAGAFMPAGELVGGIGPYGYLTGVPGQSIYLDVYMNAQVPPFCSAIVTFYQIVNGQQVVLSGVPLSAGGGYANTSLTAPDVKTPTNLTYIAGINYTNLSTGLRIGQTAYTNTFSVTVDPNTLSGLSLNPTSTQGGQTVTGTVNLADPAAQNEVIDLTSSDPTHAPVPATVTVPQGSQSVNFSLSPKVVASTEQVTITAKPDSAAGLGGGAVSGQFTLNSTPESLTGLTFAPTSVTGGASSRCTVTLKTPALSREVLQVKSSSSVASVPQTVTIPVGKSSAAFTINTSPVSANTTATITAALGSDTVAANLSVDAPVVGSFVISPSIVVGPTTTTGKMVLTGKTGSGGITYSLSSSNPAVASVPASVTVPAGSSSATFPIKAAAVKSNTTVTITVTDPITGKQHSKNMIVEK